MSEALAQTCDDFELITQIHWRNLWRKRFSYEEWYGISHPFRIRRLVTRCASRNPVSTGTFSEIFANRAVRYLGRCKPDLAITRCHFAAAELAGGRIPFIYETHSRNEEEIAKRLPQIVKSPMLKGVVTISERLRPAYERHGLAAKQLFILEDAVDFERWQNAPGKEVARQNLDLPDRFTAVYFGHLYQHRGIEDIFAAALEMPEVNFLIVGGTPEDVRKRKHEAVGLANVTLTGFVENAFIPQYCAAADCILVPYSAHLPQADIMSPLKLFESMATSRPIIASGLPAIRRHLNDKNSILVLPDSGPSLVGGIKSLRDGTVDGAALAGQALNDVRPNTWLARARRMLEIGLGSRTSS